MLARGWADTIAEAHFSQISRKWIMIYIYIYIASVTMVTVQWYSDFIMWKHGHLTRCEFILGNLCFQANSSLQSSLKRFTKKHATNQIQKKPIFVTARSKLGIVAKKSLLWGFLPLIPFGNSIVNVQFASSNSWKSRTLAQSPRTDAIIDKT